MLSWNVTEDIELNLKILSKPTPDWLTAKEKWKWGWQAHIFILGIIFLVLSLCGIASSIHLKKHVFIHKYLFVINFLITIIGLSRALYFFIDPYNSGNILPEVVSRLLYGITFPCLTASFSLILMIFMRITRIRIGFRRINEYKIVTFVIICHFLIVITLNVIASYIESMILLVLIAHLFFITWGLVLCFWFVYGGFKISQFTSESQKILKQLALYQKVKEESTINGRRLNLNLHRISKPKLSAFEDEYLQSYDSDSSDNNSIVSMPYIDDSNLNFDDEFIAKAYIDNFGNGFSNMSYYCVHDNSVEEKIKGSSANFLSNESDYITDTQSTQATLEDISIIKNLIDDNSDINYKDNNAGEQLSPTFSNHSSYNTNDGESNYFLTPLNNSDISKFSKNFINHCDIVECEDENTLSSNLTEIKCQFSEENMQESGYIADTEYYSPKHLKRKNLKLSLSSQNIPDVTDIDDTPSSPYPLPSKDGIVSLHRIRQGRTLHKALKVSYSTALLTFISCIMELYATFGVYGLLSTVKAADAWPWLVFQIIFRLVEASMSFTMVLTSFLFGRQRNNFKSRKQQQKEEIFKEQTVC